MIISYDPAKREWTMRVRGLAFDDAPLVFRSSIYEAEDARFDYGEIRIQTFGYLQDRLVVIVWTQRGAVRHIISMRKANEREVKKYAS